jgi:flagella basal body P-ring formation protein FlgA
MQLAACERELETTGDRMRLVIGFVTLALACGAAAAEPLQDPESIRSAVVQFVLGKGEPNTRYEIVVDSVDERLRLPQCGNSLDVRGNPGFRPAGMVTVAVRCNSARGWVTHVPVRVKAFRQLAVLTNAVLRGSSVGATDIALREYDISAHPNGFYTRESSVVGKIAKRSLVTGTVLSPAHLKASRWVTRGETVTLLVNAGGLQVRAQGEALADGAENDRVRARNTLTGKVVDGRVVGPGVLRVNM